MAKQSFKPSEMLAPIPVVMVTCGDMEESNIITIAWTGVVNSDPPYVYVSVRKPRYSHHMIKESGEFVINMPNESLARVTDFCGVKSGRDMDKFKETGLTKEKADIVKCPLIKEAPINLECKVIECHEYPSHDMFLAEVVAVHVDDSIIDDDNKINYARAGLVAFAHGEYLGLKKAPLGFFGYSVARPKVLKRRKKDAHDRRVKGNKKK